MWLDDYTPVDPTEGGADATLNIYYLARPLTCSLRAGDETEGLLWFASELLPRRIAFVNGRQELTAWARVTPHRSTCGGGTAVSVNAGERR